MEGIKTFSSQGEIIYSNSILVSLDNPIIRIVSDFEINMHFLPDELVDSNGIAGPRAKISVDNCLIIKMFNFFQTERDINYVKNEYFFRSFSDSSVREYYLAVNSRCLSKKKDTLLVTINISKKDFQRDGYSND